MKKRKTSRKKHRQMARSCAVLLASSMLVQTMAVDAAMADQSSLTVASVYEDTEQSKEDLSYASEGNPLQVNETTAEKNFAVNGGFEETATAASGNLKNWFVNGIYPVGWDSIWVAAAPTANPDSVRFGIDTADVTEGKNSLHYTSQDALARFEINSGAKAVVDPNKDYILKAKIKTKDVTGPKSNSNAYLRVQAVDQKGVQTGDFGSPEGARLTGTSDGWQEYEMHVKNLPATAAAVKIEIFMEYISGDVWIDDIRLVETYRVSLDETSGTMNTGETITLIPKFDREGVTDPIKWESSDPNVAAVDTNGAVNGVGVGTAQITGTIDKFHKVTFDISVEDATMAAQYETILNDWSDRLTGNNINDPSDPDYKKLMTSFKEDAEECWNSLIKANSASDNRTTLWDDLDLTIKFTSGDSNSQHSVDFDTAFNRIRSMALAYTSKGCEYYQNEALKNDILSALEWMHTHVYNEDYDVAHKLYGNWWHWQIGMPQKLADTVILMRGQLPEDLLAKEVAALNNFNQDPNNVYKISGWGTMPMASGNLMDTALVAALKGALGKNSKSLGQAKQAISTVLPYVEEINEEKEALGQPLITDGFYKDGSFIQHTTLAYTGGYGSTLLTQIEKILSIVSGTVWEVTDPKISNIYEWILEGYRPLFFDGGMMDMVTGRGIARPSRSDQTTARGILIPIVKLAASAPEETKKAILTFAKEQISAGIAYNSDYFDGMTITDITAIKSLLADPSIPSKEDGIYHKTFGTMDKAVHQAKDFALGISMYSNRIGNFEYGNGENLKGWHMSDGALYLYNGDKSQYADSYWPTVDPMRLAGITTDHTEGTINTDKWEPHLSSKNWVGGSSVLGTYGSTGMEFEIENSSLTGKKSWFSFDDEVVALGTGITSLEDKNTETIIENRKIKDSGDNKLVVNGTEVADNSKTIDSASWAYLEGNTGTDSVGYYFPEQTSVKVLREARTGNWKDINSTIKAGSEQANPIIKNYVSLAVDHGKMPKDAKYSYVLLPNKDENGVKAYSENPNVEILSNATDVQAVKEKKLGITGMNFWNPAKSGYVEAKNPASVTMAEEDGKVTLGISDPTRSNETTTITLYGTFTAASQDEGVTVTPVKNGVEISVATKDCYGKTFSVVLNGTGDPNQGQEVEKPEFTELWKRSYKQAVGIEPGTIFDLSDSALKTFVDHVNNEANGYWAIMNQASDTGRTEIFQGIKPVVAAGGNTNSAHLTTTYKYLAKLVQAYCTNGTDLYQNEEVVKEVLSAIDFTLENHWYGKDVPHNSSSTWYYGNWWDHRIGVPAQLLPIMILLKGNPELTEQRKQAYMEALAYQKANDWGSYVSANLADIGLNAMYYGILNQDEELLTKLNERFGKDMFSYVSGTGADINGWYKDGSYIDHNIYAYTGGYGSAMVSAMSRILPILSGTKFEMKFNDERDYFYSDIIMKGYLPLHAAGKLVEAVCGRSITRETSQSSTSTGHIAVFSNAFTGEVKEQIQSVVKGWLIQNPNIMKNLTRPGELMACQAILEDDTIQPKGTSESFNSYNYMDKAVKQTENYTAVVSMHSNKVANYECGNEEGKKLWNISDGALFLYNSDLNQFRGRFWPTADLLRLPGITTLHDTKRGASAGAGSKNPNTYVGSLGLGNCGITGMQIKTLGTGNNRDGLLAKKSYFMFDDEIVAVGSDIKGLNEGITAHAETVIENRKIKDDLSNKLLFNGEELDVNREGTKLVNYLEVKAPAYDKAGTDGKLIHAHSLNYAINPEARNIHIQTKMRFGATKNAALRFWGEKNDGTKGVAYELFLNNASTGELKSWGGAGVSIPGIGMEWFDVDAAIDVAAKNISIKITDASGKVTEKSGAFMSSVNNPDKITSIGFYNSGTLAGQIDVQSMKIVVDGQEKVKEDFAVTTAQELLKKDGWSAWCANGLGESWGEETHEGFTVETKQMTVDNTAEDAEVKDVKWAHLSGNTEGSDIGYYFPNAMTVKALKETRTGLWSDVNGMPGMSTTTTPVQGSYATMYVDHGVNPTGANYAYVILPGKSAEETRNYDSNPDIEIIANNEKVHSVYEKNLKMTGANFWTSGEAAAGKITAKGYASVIMKETAEGYELEIADPTHQRADEIELTIDVPTESVLEKDDAITVVETGDQLKLKVAVAGAGEDATFHASFQAKNTAPEHNTHPVSKWTVVKEATCTETGIEVGTCQIGGETVSRTIDKIAHQWKEEYTVDQEATCGAEGKESIHCFVCNQSKPDSERTIPATGKHNWGEWTIAKKPTVNSKGEEQRVCAVCKEAEKREIAQLQHTSHPVSKWILIQEPDCTMFGVEVGICELGGEMITRNINKLEHQWDSSYTVDKQAICGEEGIKSIHCSVCGQGKPGSQVTIPATGNHAWGDWMTTKEPTETKEGEAERICKVCETKETKTLPVRPTITTPSVSNIQVSDITSDGYTVTADVSAPKGIDKVLCATWTNANGQDDIIWETLAVKDGKVTYTVKTSAHKMESGIYNTHIYLYDKEGKFAFDAATADVPKEETAELKNCGHVQNIGWLDWQTEGRVGTVGHSLRLEAVKLSLDTEMEGSIEYRGHVQNIGWQDWVTDGNIVGTVGQSLRLEAIQIKLTGKVAEKYTVQYRAHVQNIGWTDWVKNGETAGTTGKNLRVEAIEVRLIKK